MRIPCPYCGLRDAQEFTCRGEAGLQRPDSDEGFFEYVYLRENPIGAYREHWYHSDGCRSWIVVTRDTLTHEISR